MFPESNVKDSVCTLINIILMLGCQQTIENNTKYLGIPLPLSQYLFPAWFVTCLSGCLGPCGCLKFGLVPEILPSSFLYMYRCAIPFLGSGFVFVLERGYPKWSGRGRKYFEVWAVMHICHLFTSGSVLCMPEICRKSCQLLMMWELLEPNVFKEPINSSML